MAKYDPRDELYSELECSVCQERYDEPVDLTCGHAFCRKCVLAIFRNSSRGYGEHYIDCPNCRKRQNITEDKIRKMNINFKIRNIITALNESDKPESADCDIHKKPFMLYCYDCDELKCLSCFVKTCSTAAHKTEETDEISKKLRSDIGVKLEKCQAKTRSMKDHHREDPLITELQFLKEYKFNNLISAIGDLRKEALEEDIKGIEKVETELQAFLSLSHSTLVEKKADVGAISVPETVNTKTTILSTECQEALEQMKKSIAKFEDLLTKHGRDPKSAPKQRTSWSDASAFETSNADTNSSSDAQMEGALGGFALGIPWPPDIDNHNYNWSYNDHFDVPHAALSPVEDLFPGLTIGSPPRSMLGLPTEFEVSSSSSSSDFPLDPDEDSLLFRKLYSHQFINSITYAGPHFLANTDSGFTHIISELDEEPGSYLDEENVGAVCQISHGKLLIITNNTLEIHRVELLSENEPIFTLPNPTGLPQDVQYECVAVTGENPIYYLVTDTANSLIHIWHSDQRGWCDAIDVGTMSSSNRRPSFKMCARFQTVYITVHHTGQIRGVNLRSGIIFSNDTACSRPNGISADDNFLYVCEAEPSQACVVVLGHDGIVRQNILSDTLERPWSVAVGDGKLAVLERYFRHRLNYSPIFVYIFDLALLVGPSS